MSDSKQPPKFKASEYLRTRRPENYSDSIITAEPQINRSLIEYHLENLTSHNEDKDFEYFARRLLEKEVCPNLIPQTGPTAGGDSKADSETYPVSEEVAERWYHGEESAKERWAIAISAQKNWQPKIRKDVKSIVGTNRGYTRIYFVSNQLIPDKKRAEVEDELKNTFGVDIRILSRDWIVDKIITNRHFDLVTENLRSARGIKFEDNRKVGPVDSGREIELADLEKQIANTDKYQGVEYQLAEDCLRCVILSSQLERPRDVVDALFARALRIAKKVGDSRQILRFTYKKAWISYFVYDDLDELSKLYDEVEKLALSLDEVDDVEFSHNLLNVLIGSIRHKETSVEKAKVEARSAALKQKLTELSQEKQRPNNAHCARTLLCLHDLALFNILPGRFSSLDDLLEELRIIIVESKGLGEYPFDSYAEIIIELGKFLDSPQYEKLFDEVISQASARKHEGEAGVLLLTRGAQKLQSNKPYDAIKFLGRAQEYLIKDEYKEELVRCLLICGAAYKEVGLLWAARAQMLSALSLALKAFHQTGVMHYTALLGAIELAWLEMELGRIPHILFCIKLSMFVAEHAKLDKEGKDRYISSLENLDAVFGVLLLKTSYSQLQKLTNLPHILDHEGMYGSTATAFFILGELEKLKEYQFITTESTDEEIEKFFTQLSSQPATEQLPANPEYFVEKNVRLIGNVLGCNIVFESDTVPVSILMAETLLAAVQSFFATSLMDGAAYTSEVHVKITSSDSMESSFGVMVYGDDLAAPLEIKHLKDFQLESKESIFKFRETIYYFIAKIAPRIAIFKDFESHLKQLAEEERVFGRSILFSDVITLSSNVFRNLDWLDLSIWTKDSNLTPYVVKRTKQWIPKKAEKPDVKSSPLKRGKGEPPPEMYDLSNKKHSDIKVLSIINIPLWDKAKWKGTFYVCYPSCQYPPTIGFMFTDEAAARSIFEEWRRKWGNYDEKEEIRISIIRELDEKNPAHYEVSIGTNFESASRDENTRYNVMTRHKRMTPDSTTNLNNFLYYYNKVGAYYLVPAILREEGKQPEILDDLFIIKRRITVKSAWQIEEHDEDIVVIDPKDTPIIPAGVNDPPILRALKRYKEM